MKGFFVKFVLIRMWAADLAHEAQNLYFTGPKPQGHRFRPL